jgi:RecB family exonuclease
MSKLSFSYTALKDFANCPLAFKHKRILKDVAFVQGAEAKWGEEVHAALEHRVKDGTPLTKEFEKFEPIAKKFDGKRVECELELCVNEHLKPTGWFDADAWIRGIVDVLVWIDDKTVFVGDYKTGKRRPDFDQLELFALLIWAHYPEVHKVKTSLVWLKENSMDSETYTRDQANELWGKVMAKIRRVYNAVDSDVWPAKPSGLCGWCDVHKQLGCKYAKVR